MFDSEAASMKKLGIDKAEVGIRNVKGATSE
jgi:hypothetical protein